MEDVSWGFEMLNPKHPSLNGPRHKVPQGPALVIQQVQIGLQEGCSIIRADVHYNVKILN